MAELQPPKRACASQTLRAWVCCGLCSCMLLAVALSSSRATDRGRTDLHASPPAVPFVTARGGRLYRGERVRRFMGANLWYAVHLGCRTSDRARLRRELDALRAAGVSSVRISALSEGPDDAPWRVVPTLQPAPGLFVADHAEGLDYTLQQLELRGMDATVTLHNMWPWSGGLAQYVAWSTGEAIPYPPPAEGGDWGTFQARALHPACNQLQHRLRSCVLPGCNRMHSQAATICTSGLRRALLRGRGSDAPGRCGRDLRGEPRLQPQRPPSRAEPGHPGVGAVQ